MSLAVASLALVAAACLATASQATSPGKNGRIAYQVKDRAGHWQIWVANSDLSGAKKLTHGRYDSGWAVWSPDGKRLAFDSSRTDHTPGDAHHVNDVFVMNADGSGVKKLTSSNGVSENPAWSQDGALIAFDHGKRPTLTAIYVKSSDGGRSRKLTNPRPPLNDYAPQFSPDGTRLVFTRERGTADNARAALFTIGLDGSGLHRLTPFSLRAGDAGWSPDGQRIVFEAYPDPKAYGDIFVVGASGGSVTDLTRNPKGQAGSADPVWSPDGTKILFLDNRYVNDVGRTGLATMNPDGSARTFISSENVEAHQPDWQPVRAGAQRHALTQGSSRTRNGPLTFFVIDNSGNGIAHIVSVAGGRTTTLWHCPTRVFCGQPVSFAWAPDGRRVAFTLDEIGANSPYVGLHVVNVVSGRDAHIPGGAPQDPITDANGAAWDAYLRKMERRIGCWPAANLAWSPDGSSIAYNCGSAIHVLDLHGSGYTTVPTGADAFWPSWSPSATRVAYSTRLTPLKTSGIYTIALDGSHRRRVARGGAAPAWSPDGRTIAYQTKCGIRLVTPSGRNVTPRAETNRCGAIGRSGPPVWSPDGTKLAVETDDGVYVMDRSGKGLHYAADLASTTWYGSLPGRPSWRAIR